MHRNEFGRAAWLAFAGLALGAAGCDAPKYDVTGKVTYNGAPLNKPQGHVVFVGPKGEQIDAPINPDGTYKAMQVTKGPNKVAVYYINPELAKSGKLARGKAGEPPPGAKSVTAFLTPEKYASPDTSELETTVDKPTVFDIPLTGPEVP